MHFVMFYHSLVSDWNHGNAHFLRGVVGELLQRGHQVDVYEPCDGWSRQHLLAFHGTDAIDRFYAAYPDLHSYLYDPDSLDLESILQGAQLVIVHEWNDPGLVKRIGRMRAQSRDFRLLFHDTHHRSVTEPKAIEAYDLEHYDGVLAFGQVIRDCYLDHQWCRAAWTWHEAADERVFYPRERGEPGGDLVWIGNWGDEERTEEIHQFLLHPLSELGFSATIHGVRYTADAQRALTAAGAQYGGWLPNFQVPEVFARHAMTVHIPRRPYRERLPGIPTIRVFEALACGIPLVCLPWEDAEGLFSPGRDYLVAHTPDQMQRHLRMLREDRQAAAELSEHGRRTLQMRHTCRHRVDELMEICCQLWGDQRTAPLGLVPAGGGENQKLMGRNA